MVTDNQNIPVAILIFDVDGQYTYKAYSPANFVVDVNNEDSTHIQLGQFLALLYNHISYDPAAPTNNQTNIGRLKEVHTRMSSVPVCARGAQIYFSTYDNPHCAYRPVHRPSPVFFDVQEADNYSGLQSALYHRSGTHEVV